MRPRRSRERRSEATAGPSDPRWIVLAALVCFLASLLGSVAPARGLESPSLALDPESAPAGSDVTATVDGFDTCPPVDDANPVSVVTVTWDGEQVGSIAVSEGAGTAGFTVPPTAGLGGHKVEAFCNGDPGLRDGDAFQVTSPPDRVQVPNLYGLSLPAAERTLVGAGLALGDQLGVGSFVVDQAPGTDVRVDRGSAIDVRLGTPIVTREVPDLDGLTLDEAAAELAAAGLELGTPSGLEGGVVDDQDPDAYTLADLGAEVSVHLRLPTAQLVEVPRLRGKTLREAGHLLRLRGLRLGPHQGKGTVVSQRPRAGRMVTADSLVSVSLDPGIPPLELVKVPDLVGYDVAQARDRLDALGLTLVGALEDGEVVGQDPAPGTWVRTGSIVSVEVEPGPGPGRLVGLVAAGLAGVAVAGRGLARRRSRTWVADHVRVERSGVSFGGQDVSEPAPDDDPGPVVRLEPSIDAGQHSSKEVGP